MRFVFKTSHDRDIDLLRHPGDWWWYAALVAILLALPAAIPAYYVGELAFIFVLAIASVGLMLLTGFTGLVSLGHAAFLLIGAYVEAHALRAGIPFGISLALAAVVSGTVGILLGLPALRLTGLYLAIATLAFSAIVEHLFAHWKFLSAGETFLNVPNPSVFGVKLGGGNGCYYVALAVLAGTILVSLNLIRSPTGRAFIALRDSPIAAETLGVALARTKTTAFALSAAIAGLAGALYAHKISTLTAESFNVLLSLELLMMVVVGGMGSIKGAVLGALFLGLLEPAIARFKDYLPPSIA
ncbi:MAG: branched-chain amino acid ABC transporter permease, partial [Alphaproteobacteria bacterium]